MATGISLRAWDGPRAIASLLVALFHVYVIFMGYNGMEGQFVQEERRNPWYFIMINGAIAVDMFKVLTGALAAYTFAFSLTGNDTKSEIKEYYLRRFARIAPIYLYGLALALLVAAHGQGLPPPPDGTISAKTVYDIWFNGCPSALPLNFLFLNNRLTLFGRDYAPGCGLTYWSMGITLQFYAVFPWIIAALRPWRPGFGRRLGVTLAVLFAASTGYRLWATAAADPPSFPLPISADVRAGPRLFSWIQSIYFPTIGRIPSLAAGVALGALLRSPATLNRIPKAWIGAAALLGEAAVLAVCIAPWHGTWDDPEWGPWAQLIYGALLHTSSPLVAIAFALTLLALATRADPIHDAAARLFSTPFFTALARLSFHLFIFHVIALYITIVGLESTSWWADLVLNQKGAAITLFTFGTLGGGYLASVAYEAGVAALERAVAGSDDGENGEKGKKKT